MAKFSFIAINLRSFSPVVFFGTLCRHAATLGVKKIHNMFSEYQLKKSNETILIYATVLFVEEIFARVFSSFFTSFSLFFVGQFKKST